MKRYALYILDENGVLYHKGQKYTFVTQFPANDKAEATANVISTKMNKGKDFYISYVGKWG